MQMCRKEITKCTYCGGALKFRTFYCPMEHVYQCQNPECGAQFFREYFILKQCHECNKRITGLKLVECTVDGVQEYIHDKCAKLLAEAHTR